MQNEGRTLWIRWEWVVGVVDVGAVECSLDDFLLERQLPLYRWDSEAARHLSVICEQARCRVGGYCCEPMLFFCVVSWGGKHQPSTIPQVENAVILRDVCVMSEEVRGGDHNTASLP
jgi:hypothetical protein